MKNVIAFLLVVVMCLTLIACNDVNKEAPESETKAQTTSPVETEPELPPDPKTIPATVITNEGKTVEVSAEDLFSEYDANEARFAKIYGGATIEFTGTVKYIKIETAVYHGDGVATEQQKIVFEEGWSLIIGSNNKTYDLADYYPGQKLKVSTGIISPAFHTEFLQNIAENDRVVWLVGNDRLWSHTYNYQTTTISLVE